MSRMTSPESPIPPRSPGFYLFRSNSSIPPPVPPTTSFFHTILPSLIRQLIRSITSILLPIILLPLHFLFLFLSILTTVLAMLFLSWRGFVVYLDIGMTTASQVYSDLVGDRGKRGEGRQEILRRVVLEREREVGRMAAERGAVRTRARRGLSIA